MYFVHLNEYRCLCIPDLSGNFLSEVKPGLFSNLSSLTDLDLSRNQLTGLKKKKVTWDLPALERLKLSHNRSFFIPKNVDIFLRKKLLSRKVKINLNEKTLKSSC